MSSTPARSGSGRSSASRWPAAAAPTHDERRLKSVLARRRSKSEEFFASASGEWDRVREELFGDTFQLHALLALLDRDAVVGDLGCGTGKLTELVAPHVRRVIAVDGSPDMLHAARARLQGQPNVEIRQGNLEALPIDDAQLDIAVMGLVLHHVPDPGVWRCAESAPRAQGKRGGRVLIIDMLPHDRAEYQQQMGHVWLGFPERQMRKMLTGAGIRRRSHSPLTDRCRSKRAGALRRRRGEGVAGHEARA